ncbi:pilus assembly protein N-terminal domain-containing protein [Parvularcula sp. LCG005]|uniref:pilus assembly protein N-terminal domain-containing protein n=1 Tax=Parvularcula sp. LCG005 TaxID=3078805 RepID=UPI002941F86A|nr:pilus assembly protein N-terminal domain-containing protein [Parvularcula sp. LCG005]WOI53558.1 pilus assembly protein N-terminal domain-containing protein [Parvularcula sp. LCG005]
MQRHILCLVPFAALSMAPAMAGDVNVVIDQAQLFQVQEPIGSVVVANPSIADIKVLSPTELVLFGKMPGATNLFLFDRDGKPVKNIALNVTNGGANTITVFSGAYRHTYACANTCEPTYTVGDGVHGIRATGTDVAEQVTTKQELATTAAQGSSSTAAERGTTGMRAPTTDNPEG